MNTYIIYITYNYNKHINIYDLQWLTRVSGLKECKRTVCTGEPNDPQKVGRSGAHCRVPLESVSGSCRICAGKLMSLSCKPGEVCLK